MCNRRPWTGRERPDLAGPAGSRRASRTVGRRGPRADADRAFARSAQAVTRGARSRKPRARKGAYRLVNCSDQALPTLVRVLKQNRCDLGLEGVWASGRPVSGAARSAPGGAIAGGGRRSNGQRGNASKICWRSFFSPLSPGRIAYGMDKLKRPTHVGSRHSMSSRLVA